MERKFSSEELSAMSPKEFHSIVRQGEFTGITPDACCGYAQADLVVIPEEMAFEFLLFCQRNPRPCPILDVTEPGDPHPRLVAPEADLRTDVPKYRVYKDGKLVDEPTDVTSYWRDDLVAFIIGCSFSFVWLLRAENVKFRPHETGIYATNINCVPAGRFHGRLAVSGHFAQDTVRPVQVSSRYPAFHGPPVHIGDPAIIGIKDIYKPDHSTSPEPIEPQKPDEVPMFWACGVTPQVVALDSKVPFMITHYPAHMFVTDRRIEEFACL